MSLETLVCPTCKVDLDVEKSHNLLNLSMGLSLGTVLGVATHNPALGFAFGPMYYLLDIPFGPNKTSYCPKCDYSKKL